MSKTITAGTGMSGTTTTAWPPPPNHLGTCGACGGRVMQESVWAGSYPPPKVCEQCGRTAKDPEPVMPVYEMWSKP